MSAIDDLPPLRDVVELTADSIRKGDPVKAGIELLDASRNGIVDARVLKERQQLEIGRAHV